MDFVVTFQWLYFMYFLGLNGGYFLLCVLSLFSLPRYLQERRMGNLNRLNPRLQLPISVLVPAYNEGPCIEPSLRSLLQLDYPEYEVIVCNDGSKDNTLDVLIKAFRLVAFPEADRGGLHTKAVKGIYRSTLFSNLLVIDKENGGKADALNAAMNRSRYPLFCCLDADSILQRDSLQRLVQPFLSDPATVATGGFVRVVNGCEVRHGCITKKALPRNIVALFQIVEYLRAFLFGRTGWSVLNAMLIISGAFGIFRKETVVRVGGYREATIGEDMELVVRLHRELRLAGEPCRIVFLPDAVCWTEAPEDLKTLKNQRVRWQRGLAESLMANRGLLFRRKGGLVSWVALPFFMFFEWLGPLIELLGTVFIVLGYFCGYLSMRAMVAFLCMAFGCGMLLSVKALFLEEMSFHTYPRLRQILVLFLAMIAENFGFRQLNAWWRLVGLYRWARGTQGKWGEMTRKASWSVAGADGATTATTGAQPAPDWSFDLCDEESPGYVSGTLVQVEPAHGAEAAELEEVVAGSSRLGGG